MRAWARRNQNKIGLSNHGAYRLGNCGRRIDKSERVTSRFKIVQFRLKLGNGRGSEGRSFCLADVPPCSKRALRIGINQDCGAVSGKLGGDCEVSRKSGFTASTLLAG